MENLVYKKEMIKARENIIGAWAFLIGSILAIIVGVVSAITRNTTADPIILWILAILGLVVGFFVAEKDVKTFLIAAVAVVAVCYMGIQGLVINSAILGAGIDKFVTSVLGSLLFFFIPATIIVALKTVFSLAKS